MPSHIKDQVIAALLSAHPYEEVAYDLYALENEYNEAGLGCVGELTEPNEENEFLLHLSEIFKAEGIRYSKFTGKKIKKVALCGGAGITLLGEALKSGADAFVTADIKYHDFFNRRWKLEQLRNLALDVTEHLCYYGRARERIRRNPDTDGRSQHYVLLKLNQGIRFSHQLC